VSGQIPRVGDQVVATGRAGAEVSLEQARAAARISTLRALALLQRALGSLDQVDRILRITVYVQCTADFTQHSEVADAASDLLHTVLGEAGIHARTSIGVYQLPKNATVELELQAAVLP
jgi:enamine deaminase RidA (YjgF/YER057c/UK114 family)